VISDLNCFQLLIAEPLRMFVNGFYALFGNFATAPSFSGSAKIQTIVTHIQNAVQEDSGNRTCHGIALGTFISLQWQAVYLNRYDRNTLCCLQLQIVHLNVYDTQCVRAKLKGSKKKSSVLSILPFPPC
jgi:hypothetical protein